MAARSASTSVVRASEHSDIRIAQDVAFGSRSLKWFLATSPMLTMAERDRCGAILNRLELAGQDALTAISKSTVQYSKD